MASVWNPREREDTCYTEDCLVSAATIAGTLDTSVDPCENFAEFACGNFYKTEKFDPGEVMRSSFSIIDRRTNEILKNIIMEDTKPTDPDYLVKIKTMYRSCMNEDQIEAIGLQPFLDTEFAKQWPTLIGQIWSGEATFDLNDVMAEHMLIGVRSITKFDIMKDVKNSSRKTLYLKSAHLMLERDYLLRERNDSTVEALETYLRDMAVELGADPTVAQQDAAAVVDLQRELANITVPDEEQLDHHAMYHPMTLAQLGRNYSYIDIARALRASFSTANVTLADDQHIIVQFPSFWEQLQAVLDNTDNRTLRNLFGFQAAFKMVIKLTKRLRQIHLEYNRVKLGTKSESPRWETCMANTKSYLGWGISKEFVRREFSEDSKTFLNSMIDELKRTFRDTLRDAIWMSNITRARAYLKLDKMARKIGYPDKGFTEEDINELYKEYQMTPDNFYQNRLTALNLNRAKKYKAMENPDEDMWETYPHVVNAYYNPIENEIIFPAGVLQPPVFWPKHPDSVNYGSAGGIIGHEISHGFDDTGAQYDADGHLVNWWQLSDLVMFEERKQCIVDQFGAFKDEQVGLNVNGILSQGEALADNAGLKMSYNAYKKHVQRNGEQKLLPGIPFNHDQLFFIGLAQSFCEVYTPEALIYILSDSSHPPGRYRMIGSMQNFPEFAKAYNCKAGSPMNPEQKCRVW